MVVVIPFDHFDWTDNADVAAAIGAQLTAAIAQLVNNGRDETDLINGFLANRYAFVVAADGVAVIATKQHGERQDL